MPELGTYGSVRGAVGNNRPYRERRRLCQRHPSSETAPAPPCSAPQGKIPSLS
jgi:hypothetical protein